MIKNALFFHKGLERFDEHGYAKSSMDSSEVGLVNFLKQFLSCMSKCN